MSAIRPSGNARLPRHAPASPIPVSPILGIPVSREAEWETVERIVGWAAARRPAKVTYANPYVLALARRDPGFGRTLASFDLVYPDGIGTVWASRLVGCPIRERVTASDFHPSLFRRSAEEGIGIYLLGGAPGVAARAAQALRAAHPGIRVLGAAHGYPSPDAERSLLAEIARLRPALLVVAMGTATQERWIERHAGDLPPLVAWGVGGLLDFISGKARRAPRWMIATRTEWIFRLAREPARLARRYTLENLFFGAYILRDLVRAPGVSGGRGGGERGGRDETPGPGP